MTVARTADAIAAVLRDQIRDRELQPGDQLPTMDQLMTTYGVARATALRALATLKAEGLAEYRAGRGGGTVVRARSTQRMVRSRGIERDDMGYYSGPTVQHWRSVPGSATTTVDRPAPDDIAELLGIPPGTSVLVRERMNGDPERPELRQLTDSWLHPDIVAALPILRGSTGLGGTYDRIEEWAGRPIAWTEEITAATPSPAEAEALLLPTGVPLLRVLRVSTLGRGKRAAVVEVQDIRMSGELF
ncbi:GntR family transcriptional regulator, partial [Streptomyces bacillaris]